VLLESSALTGNRSISVGNNRSLGSCGFKLPQDEFHATTLI
jgi:hypothetical protein